MKRALFTLVSVALAACSAVNPESLRSAKLGEEVTLAPGERARFDDSKLEVQFAGVAEDSRCPSDATCVWAGEVKVRLFIREGSSAPAEHVTAQAEPAAVGAYRIHVVRVSPEKLADKPIAASDYRVTLVAGKN